MPWASLTWAPRLTSLWLASHVGLALHRVWQLKPKLATLRALPEAHSLKAKLKEALVHHTPGVEFDASLTPDAMLTQLIEANDDLYDVIGQLSIALHEAMGATPGYQPFLDHELHSDDAEHRLEPREHPAVQEGLAATATGRRGVSDAATTYDDDETGYDDDLYSHERGGM